MNRKLVPAINTVQHDQWRLSHTDELEYRRVTISIHDAPTHHASHGTQTGDLVGKQDQKLFRSLIAQQLGARKASPESERHNRRSQDEEKQAALNDRLMNLDLQETEIASEIAVAKRRRAMGQKTVDQYLSLQVQARNHQVGRARD